MYVETELAFKFLCTQEPRLRELADDCRRYWLSHRSDSEVERAWFLGFKPTMSQLVGHGAGATSPELKSCQAYDLCYQALFNILTTGREAK